MRARTWLATLPFLATSAAMRRSDRRPLVHEPTKATSILAPLMGWPAWKPMWASASRKVGRSASGCASGDGMLLVTPTDISGLIPHVTTGSRATDFHHADARSKAAPEGA